MQALSTLLLVVASVFFSKGLVLESAYLFGSAVVNFIASITMWKLAISWIDLKILSSTSIVMPVFREIVQALKSGQEAVSSIVELNQKTTTVIEKLTDIALKPSDRRNGLPADI